MSRVIRLAGTPRLVEQPGEAARVQRGAIQLPRPADLVLLDADDDGDRVLGQRHGSTSSSMA